MKARYEVIEREMKEQPKREIFRLLKVDKSSFYRWAKERSNGQEKDVIKEQIDNIFWRHGRRYGSRRIYYELRDEGFSAGRHRIR